MIILAKKKATGASTRNQAKDHKPTIFSVLPIFLTVALVPLIMRLRIVELDPQSAQVWIEGSHNLDFNAYWKMIFLVVLAVFAGLMLLMERFLSKKPFISPKWCIPVGVFSVFTILSTLFSENKTVALRGVMDHYEGMWALLAYMLLFVATLYLLQTNHQRRFVLHGLLISSGVIGLIGTLQWLGYDPIIAPWFQRLMLPSELHHAIADTGHTGGGHDVYATLGNSNYVGSFAALTLPVMLAASFTNRNKAVKILYSIASLLLVTTLVGSQSRAGIAAVLVILVLSVVIILLKTTGKPQKMALGLSAAMAILILATLTIHPQILNRTLAEIQPREHPAGLTDLWIQDNRITMDTTQGILQIQYNEDKTLTILDDDGYEIQSDSLSHFAINIDHSSDVPILRVDSGKKEMEFPFIEESFHIIDASGETRPYEYVEKWGFEGREHLGTRRGYTWSRTIPLLKNHIFIGAGPGNFLFQFPQDDFIGQLQGHNHPNRLVSNPHNDYLQTAIYTGVLSLLALLFMIGQFFFEWRSLSHQKLDLTQENHLLLMAITLGVAGYLVAAIFNDSIVAIAPLFWILLAMGITLLSECQIGDRVKNEKTKA